MKSTKKQPNKAQNTEKESTNIYLAGTVTTAMYGRRTFSNGKSDKEDKYRISLKVTYDTLKKLVEAAEPFYENVEEKWLPDWLTKEPEEDGGFVNMSSNFDIRIGEYKDGKIADLGTMADYLADNGGNINGSKVIVSVTIKPGAIYPAAMIIKELHTVDISSMFNTEDDEFKAVFDGDDLPFK